jgi:hypothetical protein
VNSGALKVETGQVKEASGKWSVENPETLRPWALKAGYKQTEAGVNGTPSPSLASRHPEPSWGLALRFRVPGDFMKTKGWYSRGYLPHFDAAGATQFITFRLADSLPQDVLDRIEMELEQMPMTERELERYRKIERWLDSGLGCCALRHPQVALLVQDTLQHADGESYRLIEWCIMPNHVHVLIEQKISLPKILQSWKSYTGRWAMAHNAELGLGVPPGHF